MLKLAIVVFVFPILVLTFHVLFIVPAFFVGPLLVHFGGYPQFWWKTLSIVALLLACWGAFIVCKWIWHNLK
jgi:hypothetical protein